MSRAHKMPNRLALILGLALLSAPLVAQTQAAEKVWRVGVLTAERPGALEALIDGLRELGYTEGRNLMLVHRQFSGNDQMASLARELVALHPHVIVTGHGRSARVLRAVTQTVPIVMANSGDAVAQGLVASLARPSNRSRAGTCYDTSFLSVVIWPAAAHPSVPRGAHQDGQGARAADSAVGTGAGG